jgi:hypothetical protein
MSLLDALNIVGWGISHRRRCQFASRPLFAPDLLICHVPSPDRLGYENPISL